jgi:hypothetical protein
MTILGLPTLAEEIDLIAAKDYQTKQLSDAFKVYSPTWLMRDGAGMAKWLADWGAFWNRWSVARSKAQAEISANKLNPVPNSHIGAGAWSEILKAFSATPNRVSPGDFSDLVTRFQQAGGKVDMRDTPQPSASDLDLQSIHALDTTLHTVEQVPVLGPLASSLARNVGWQRDTADAPSKKDESAAKMKTGFIVGGIAVGVLVALKALK